VPSADLSITAARRIAIASQGFGARPASPPSTARMLKLIRQLGVLQLDSVNVFSRAHYMPLFSRLGPYDRAALDRLAAHTPGRIDRRLVEYWAHEASLIPVELHPLFRWRMANIEGAWSSMQEIVDKRPGLVEKTLEQVAQDGPIRARDTGSVPNPYTYGAMWNWHDGKVALEHLFFVGQVGAARRINFERHYDLIERILPSEVHDSPTLSTEDAQRELIRIAARAQGVATIADLADYWRITKSRTTPRVAELIELGELREVSVAGWSDPAYLWHEARTPGKRNLRALLSPFDSLVWFRPRTERLFDFHYRIEIYTPKPKRVYGYYVLPFLLGDRLVGRVDLKADRQAGVLRVQSAHAEDGVDHAQVAPELMAELLTTAEWLGLQGVEVAQSGNLAQQLLSEQ
jgi:uncharacterized protein